MHSPVLKYNIDEYTDSSNPFFFIIDLWNKAVFLLITRINEMK